MAIPTSTIVLAVLTAVPFGLAIKDTVQGTSAFDAPTEELHEVDEPTEVMDRAAMEYEQAEQKRSLEIEGAIKALIPDTKAELHVDEMQIASKLHGTVSRQARMTTLAFPQFVGDTMLCAAIGERLESVWGSAEHVYSELYTNRTWTAQTPQQRVTYRDPNGDEVRCELVIESYATVAAFVNRTEASTVPLWAIGKPPAKLVEKLGDNAFSDDTQIRWNAEGVGQGYGSTELYARIVKGKIVTITAKLQATNETMLALSEQLTKDYGEAVEGSTWKKAKLTIDTLDDEGGEYMITVGAPLPEDNE